MTKSAATRLVVSLLLASLWGCGIGYNRMLFVTKTNVGLEADTKPPSLQLAIGRLEGVFAPQFRGGRKLPVLASFKFANEGAFSPFVGSAFSTGDAALVLSSLYSDKTPSGNWQNRLNSVRPSAPDGQKVDSALTLNRKPVITSWLGTLLGDGEFQGDDVRPVFFGTDTSLGVKVAWSGLTSYIPDTARFGYARKELAWVPITIEEVSNPSSSDTKYKVKTASLLATLDSGLSDVKIEGNQPSARFSYVQYFASGDAATLLAMQETVRQAMLTRLDPHARTRALQFKRGLAGEPRVQQMLYMAQVYNALLVAKDRNDLEATTIVGGLDRIGERVPQEYTRYSWFPKATPSPKLQSEKRRRGAGAPSFAQVTAYWGAMNGTVEALQSAATKLKTDPQFTFQIQEEAASAVNVTPQELGRLMIEFKEISEKFTQFDQELQRDPAVIAAVTYFTKSILAME